MSDSVIREQYKTCGLLFRTWHLHSAGTFNLLFNVSSRECKMNKLCLSYKSNLILHVLKPNLNSHSFVPLTVNICETPVKNVDVSNRSKMKRKSCTDFTWVNPFTPCLYFHLPSHIGLFFVINLLALLGVKKRLHLPKWCIIEGVSHSLLIINDIITIGSTTPYEAAATA